MIKLVLIGILNCPMPQYFNQSPYAWNDHDQRIVVNNQQSCERIWGAEFKCLKSFTKRDNMVYWVVCSMPLKDIETVKFQKESK